VLAWLATAPSVHAQCAGFTDVAPGGFCGNVTWIKNRQVTVGCSATTYCPFEPVTRLQMAAFMMRLGRVLVPNVVSATDSGGPLSIAPSPAYVCATSQLPAVNYTRKMQSNVALSYDVSDTQEVQIGIAKSTNGGAFQATATTGTRGPAGQHLHHHNALGIVDTLDAGNTYAFAVFVGRGGPQFNSILAWACQLQAYVYTE
jgi:hypothetical protein